jgi:hypothetical protein
MLPLPHSSELTDAFNPEIAISGPIVSSSIAVDGSENGGSGNKMGTAGRSVCASVMADLVLKAPTDANWVFTGILIRNTSQKAHPYLSASGNLHQSNVMPSDAVMRWVMAAWTFVVSKWPTGVLFILGLQLVVECADLSKLFQNVSRNPKKEMKIICF